MLEKIISDIRENIATEKNVFDGGETQIQVSRLLLETGRPVKEIPEMGN